VLVFYLQAIQVLGASTPVNSSEVSELRHASTDPTTVFSTAVNQQTPPSSTSEHKVPLNTVTNTTTISLHGLGKIILADGTKVISGGETSHAKVVTSLNPTEKVGLHRPQDKVPSVPPKKRTLESTDDPHSKRQSVEEEPQPCANPGCHLLNASVPYVHNLLGGDFEVWSGNRLHNIKTGDVARCTTKGLWITGNPQKAGITFLCDGTFCKV
jgi:hypothetical protein